MLQRACESFASKHTPPLQAWSGQYLSTITGGRWDSIDLSREDRLVVEGVNIVKKHAKPNPMKGVTGGIVEKTMSIHQSNVAIFNGATGKADRVGVKLLADGKKVRVYKSSGEEIKVA